jgi:hypothetical protein
MPNNSSWNGRWSGEGLCYARVVNVGHSKKAREKYEKLAGRHTYNFGDGWTACVAVREVSATEAKKLRKQTVGFAGYDWMISSLQVHGEIRA